MHYKRNKRRVLALFVLVAAVIVSISILTPSDEKKSDTPKDIAVRTDSNLQFKSGGSNLLGSITEDLTPRTRTQKETDNLTDVLIKSYLQKIYEKSDSLPPKEEVTAYLQGQLSGELPDIKKFTLSDIIISPDNSESNQINYLETLDALLRKRLSAFVDENVNVTLTLEGFFEDNDPTLINYLVKNIPLFIDDMLVLSAPELWKEAHLEFLNLWQEKLVTYNAVSNYQIDPLKAYLALQNISEIAEKDVNIQSVFIARYQELTSSP